MGIGNFFKSATRLFRIVVVVSSVAISSAWAVGLGELKTSSDLGRPFSATVDILGNVSDINPENLLIRSVQAAEAAAMDIEILPSQARMDLALRASGNGYVIDINSDVAVNEPFFNVFIELRWPAGVIYREYSVLLDPPSIALSRSSTKSQTVVRQTTSSNARPTAPSSGGATGRASVSAQSLNVSSTSNYKVQSGDNLSLIAGRINNTGKVSRSEVADWILKNNQRAFVRGNPNLLKAGVVLKLPDFGDASAETASVSQNASEAQEQNISVASSSQKTVNAQLSSEVRGLLTVSSLSSDDRAQELMDMLSRENESLRDKIDNMEKSEYVQTMKDLVTSQREQIKDMQNRLGVDGSAYLEKTEPMLAQLEQELTLQATTVAAVQADKAGTGKFDNPDTATLGAIKLDVLVPEVLRNPSKKRNYFFFWFTIAAVVFFAVLFIAMYVYYRILVKAKNALTVDQYGRLKKVANTSKTVLGESGPYGRTAYASGNMAATKRDEDIEFEQPTKLDEPVSEPLKQSNLGTLLVPELTEDGQDNADWFGDKIEIQQRRNKTYADTVKQIQEDFAEMSPDDDGAMEDISSQKVVSDVIEGLTSPLPSDAKEDDLSVNYKFDDSESVDAQNNMKVSSIFGRKRRKDEPALPSEDELKTSIAEKMSSYNPTGQQHDSNSYGLDAFGLDEIMGDEDMIGDEVDAVLYRSRLYCDYRKYKQAYKLVEDAMEKNEDERLSKELERVSKFLKVEEKPSA